MQFKNVVRHQSSERLRVPFELRNSHRYRSFNRNHLSVKDLKLNSKCKDGKVWYDCKNAVHWSHDELFQDECYMIKKFEMANNDILPRKNGLPFNFARLRKLSQPRPELALSASFHSIHWSVDLTLISIAGRSCSVNDLSFAVALCRGQEIACNRPHLHLRPLYKDLELNSASMR